MRKIIPKDAVLIPDAANRVFKGVVYDVYQWEQELFDGSHATFEMLKRPDTASVLPVVDNKVVILNEEQSHRGFKITFPSGRVDPADTSMLETAQRETFEETGYRF